MSYAEKTKVSVGQSQSEIRSILTKYDATSFQYGEKADMASVQFEMIERRIRFVLPLAQNGWFKDRKGRIASKIQVEQENRRRWRCLGLVIKAKLEAVESGITSIEQEFMAHIVLPNGNTVGTVMIPQISSAYKDGKMPPLLGYEED